MKVIYDVYSNTIMVEAKDCVIEIISEEWIYECISDKKLLKNVINFKISLIAVNCHVHEINLPNTIISKLDLTGSVIKGSVNFCNTRFLNDIICVGTFFLDEVTFLCASFEGNVRMDYAIFEGEVDFAYIDGEDMSFLYSRFNNITYWDEMNLIGILQFENAVFKLSVYIERCVIEKGLILKEAIGRGDCKLEDIYTQSIDLSGIIVERKLTIKNIKNHMNKLAVKINDQLYFDVYDSGLA